MSTDTGGLNTFDEICITGVATVISFAVRGYPRGVIVKAMDCGIVVSSNSSSRYYVPFRANTLGKGMSPLILPAMG